MGEGNPKTHFTLTPALSRRERENTPMPDRSPKFDALAIVLAAVTLLLVQDDGASLRIARIAG